MKLKVALSCNRCFSFHWILALSLFFNLSAAAFGKGPGTARFASAAAAAAPAPTPKVSTLTDNFDNNNLDTTKWTKFQGTNYNVAVTNQQLRVTNTVNTSNWGGILSNNRYDATASELRINLLQAGNSSSQNGWTWIKLNKNANNSDTVEVSVHGGSLIAKKFVGGTGTVLATTPYNAAAMQWLRIRESAGTTYWEYAANYQGPWTTLSSASDPIVLSSVSVEMGVGAWPGTSGTMILDNVNTAPSPTSGPTPIRIHCGGSAYTDSLGQVWSADAYFANGSTATSTAPITGTPDQALYQTERYAQTLTYNIPVANGNYEVTLDFAENYWNAAGKRVFNVAIQGQTVLQNFDIWALTGQNSALQRTFVVAITNGVLNIVGTASVDNAKFSAIQVLPKTGDLYLHPVLALPKYVVHYALDNGPTTVSLIGDGSHTHQQGHHLTSWTWTEGGTVLGTQADVNVAFALGQHTVTLAIADDNSPPRTASDSGTFTVYPINAVGGLFTSYYVANGQTPGQLIDSLPSLPNYEEVLLKAEIDNLAGKIGGSPFSSNVVAVMDGMLNVPTAATYQFTLTGGSTTRFYLNGTLVSGPVSLQAGSYTIQARFAIDSTSLLPAQILTSINGAAATAIDPTTLSHDETNLKPFINSMPTTGSPLGGDVVTISGIDFFPTSSVSVQWGGTTLSGSSITVTPYSIQFTTPPGTGTITVTVIAPNGTSNSYTFTYVQGQVPITFTSPTTIANPTSPTAAAWGPDGRLYVVSDQGNITIYTFDDNYNVTATQVVGTIAALSNKSILGVGFNPTDPPNPVKLYVGHAKLYAEGGGSFTGPAPYNGQVSILTGPDFSTVQPLITQLPVSNHDHAINGLQFDNNGDLLICNGGNTNAGVPAPKIGNLPESPLSAAILKALVSKTNFNGALSYVDTASGQPDNDQVNGDHVDLAPGTDVSVYVPGNRNPFDIVWTTRGMLYGTDNGMNATYGPISTSATTQAPESDVPDKINYLVEGHYYGHPNRNRGRYDDRQNVFHYPTDPETFGTYNGSPLATVTSSSDGIDEYRATTFNGEMRGDLLVQRYNGVLYHAVLSADGRSIPNVTTLANTSALGVVTGPGGVIICSDHDGNRVAILKPQDAAATTMTAYDIFPWRARPDGSPTFVIGGTGFDTLADTTVTIGGVSATVTSVSPTRIKGVIPANTTPTPQLLDVVVQSGGLTSTIPQAFRYMQGTSSGSGSWQTGPALPIASGEVATAAVNGILYVVGGDTTATLAYDLKAGTWRSDLAVRPFPGNHHSAEVIHSKLYLFGGFDGGSEGRVQIYDPNTNTWSTGTPAPYAGGSVSTALIAGKVYMAGGIVSGATVSSAAVYDPVSDSWSSIASMPVGRNHAAAGTDGQKLFIFGGRDGGNVPAIGFNDVQIYDPASGTWQWSGSIGSNIPPLPQPRGGMGKAPFYGGEFYVMGGETTSAGTGQVAGNVYNRVDVFNPLTLTWRLETTMPTARHGISPVAVDSRIMVAGGGVQAGHSMSAVFELFSR